MDGTCCFLWRLLFNGAGWSFKLQDTNHSCINNSNNNTTRTSSKHKHTTEYSPQKYRTRMKLPLLALATGASAAVIKRDIVFEVRNFTASCVPHSAMCLYVPPYLSSSLPFQSGS